MRFVNFAQKNSFRQDFRSRSCALISTAAFIFFLFSLCIVPTYAAEVDSINGGVSNEISSQTNVPDQYSVQTTRSDSESVLEINFDQPLAVYQVPNPYRIEPAAMIGDVYVGSLSSTILTYMAGFVPDMSDYLIYRSGQATYNLYYGNDFEVNSRVVTGTGRRVTYNSTDQTVSFSDANFSINTGNAANVYSNLEGYSNYDGLREVSDSAFQSILLFAIFIADVLRWIWK